MAHSVDGRRRAGITVRAVCEAIEPRRYFSVGFAAPVELTVPGAGAPLDEAFLTGNGNAVDLTVGVSDAVQILIGNNDGTFTLGDRIALPSNPTSEKSFLTGDFSGTGTDDIVLLSRYSGMLNGASTSEGLITYETSNGDGSFTRGSTSLITDHDLGFTPINAAVGDFNGDGDDDLAVLGKPGTGSQLVLAIMTSNGAGGFTEIADYTVTGSNSSGNLSNELILSAPGISLDAGVAIEDKSSSSGNLDIFTDDGSGSLTQLTPIHLQADIITAGPFGVDSHGDLVAADGNKITMIIGYDDGGYGVGPSQTVNGTISALASADFDHDGILDIVTNLGVQLGNEDRTFQAPISLPGLGGGAVFANDIIAGDINGDSSPDIVGFSSAGNTIASALNDSGIPTSIGITSSEDPASPGDDVMFTATVTPLSQTGSTPTGTVEFFDGTTELGSASLVNAVATFDAGTGLAAGLNSLTAQYSGDSTFNPSTSAMFSEGVETPTSVTLTSSENPSNFGDDIIFTATVAGRDREGDVPTGLVYFNEDEFGLISGSLGSAQVDKNGVATFETAELSVGTHYISVEYIGDTNYLVSDSESPIVQTVNPSTALDAAIASTTLPAVVVGSRAIHTKAKAKIIVTNETGSVIDGPAVATIFAYTDGIVDGLGPSIGSLRVPDLKIRPETTVPVTVRINAALSAGTYTLVAQVSYKSGTTTDSVGGPTLTVAAPSVSISSVMGAITPTTVKSGGTGNFDLTLTDNGNVNSVGEATIAIGLSSDGATLAATLTPVKRPLTLKVGKPRTLVLHLKIPKGFEPGTYFPIITFTQGTTTFDAVGMVPFDVG